MDGDQMKKIRPGILAILLIAGVVWAGGAISISGGGSGGATTPDSVATPFVDAGVVKAGELHLVTGGGTKLVNSAGVVEVTGTGVKTVSATGYFWINDNGSIYVNSGGTKRLHYDGTHIAVNGSFNLEGGSLYHIGKLTISGTAPTVTGFCTSPSVTWNNGSAAFQLDVGTSCTGISTGTITLPAATNGWKCDCSNITAAGLVRRVEQAGGSTTTATLQSVSQTTGLAVDWTDGDDVRCMCLGG